MVTAKRAVAAMAAPFTGSYAYQLDTPTPEKDIVADGLADYQFVPEVCFRIRPTLLVSRCLVVSADAVGRHKNPLSTGSSQIRTEPKSRALVNLIKPDLGESKGIPTSCSGRGDE